MRTGVPRWKCRQREGVSEDARHGVAGESYPYPFGSGASEATELLRNKMVTNDKRSVHRLSRAVQ